MRKEITTPKLIGITVAALALAAAVLLVWMRGVAYLNEHNDRTAAIVLVVAPLALVYVIVFILSIRIGKRD